jgi:DNA polymerase
MSGKAAALHRLQRRAQALLSVVYRDQEKVLVFGEGNPGAAVMLVGEAPGEQETLKQRPFVGKAGKNLDDFLKGAGLRREDLYITNVVKFRPTRTHERTGRLSNRPPTREEIELCYHMLAGEMAIVAPRVVVTLGNTPLRTILDDPGAAIGAYHGRPCPAQMEGTSFLLFPLYHPASLIYNRTLRDAYLADVDRLSRWLREQGWV